MLRNHLAAALRHLARNRMYAAISVLGLAVGLWAALVSGLVVRSQFSFDHLVTGHQQVYLAATRAHAGGRAGRMVAEAPGRVGPRLKQRFAGIVAGARLQRTSVRIRQGGSEVEMNGSGDLTRFFVDDNIQARYLSLLRQVQMFGIFSLLAASLACLGLLALAASVAQQRTREIGIRNALGATTGSIVALLLWQFSRPVLLANLIVWPLAGWAMRPWLDGFAYRIDLPLWLFPATTLVTMLIAMATVGGHALRVSRTSPVTALRHQ